MGNCWPKPVESVATGSIKPPSPVHKNDFGKVPAGASPLPSPPPPAKKKPAGGSAAVPASGMIVTPNLHKFNLAELKRATQNFRPDTVLGEGGFGRVFKGYIDENTYAPSRIGVGMPVAVKKSNPDSEQGLKEWQAEVVFLGKFSHPNLVKLLGYCWEERQFLLVYEYMQRGSLESHLFRKGGEALAWDIRMKIAVGAAKGLAFLHNTEKQVIYRDFKASNILLDGEFNPKLSDFGLAKLGPEDGNSHVTTNPVGTYGYAAPEYIATGHLYVRSDVYGFGVVLLEIITGLRVLDLNRPGGQTNLVEWALPSLQDKKKFRRLIDPRLMGQYPLKAAYEIGELILNCLKEDPKCRPEMQEVLDSLEHINANHPKITDCKAMPKHEAPCQQRRQAGHRSHNGKDGAKGKGVGHRQQKNSKATHQS